MKKRLLLVLVLFFFLVNPSEWSITLAQERVTGPQELKELYSHILTEKIEEIEIIFTRNDEEFYLDDVGRYLQEVVDEQDAYLKNTISSWDISLSSTGEIVEIEILFQYLSSREEDLYVFEVARKVVEELTTLKMNPHMMVKVLYHHVVERIQYDFSYTNYSAYEALTQGKAVCQGYALFLYMLLKEAGFKTTIVRGNMKGELHGWNMVVIDNKWYHLDATQDSTHFHSHGENPYNHYALTDQQLARTHSWIQNEYPVASHNYFQELVHLMEEKKEEAEIYQDLMNDIHLHYLLEENTARTQESLTRIIKEAILEKKPKVSMRSFDPFYRGDVFSVIFQEITTSNPEITHYLAGYGARKRDYPKDNYSNSMILTMIFNYH